MGRGGEVEVEGRGAKERGGGRERDREEWDLRRRGLGEGTWCVTEGNGGEREKNV